MMNFESWKRCGVACRFSIAVNYYDDTGVFVGTSDDIPGLTLETGTIAKLLEVAMDIVPELLASNLDIPNGSLVEIVWR